LFAKSAYNFNEISMYVKLLNTVIFRVGNVYIFQLFIYFHVPRVIKFSGFVTRAPAVVTKLQNEVSLAGECLNPLIASVSNPYVSGFINIKPVWNQKLSVSTSFLSKCKQESSIFIKNLYTVSVPVDCVQHLIIVTKF